jgi:hypothetical protein
MATIYRVSDDHELGDGLQSPAVCDEAKIIAQQCADDEGEPVRLEWSEDGEEYSLIFSPR